jgi:hypothetical protein
MGSAVVTTLHNESGDRCVKVIRHAEGRFGFQEFRKDPEDAGGWTLVSDARGSIHATEGHAQAAARAGVGWLRDLAPGTED